MNLPLLAYPAILATIVSVIGLTRLAARRYDPANPRTLSEMATLSARSMLVFRLILYPCSLLFGVTILLFIAPRSSQSLLVGVAGSSMCVSEMILAAIPAAGKQQKRLHNVFGYIMGASMFALVVLFAGLLHGLPDVAEKVILVSMTVLFAAMILDRKRFIFFELPYIYLSHISIVVMALGMVSAT